MVQALSFGACECDNQHVKSSPSSSPITGLFWARTGYIFSNLSFGQVKLMAIVIGLHANVCCPNKTGRVTFMKTCPAVWLTLLFIWHTGKSTPSHTWKWSWVQSSAHLNPVKLYTIWYKLYTTCTARLNLLRSAICSTADSHCHWDQFFFAKLFW